MSYELLYNKFKELKVENLKVKELYILKVGCISYSEEFDEDEDEAPSDIEKESELPFADEILKNVFDALGKHQNVFDIKIENDDKGWEISTNNHTFISTGNINLRIEQPVRFQKYSDFSNIRPIEKFYVTFNGSTYIAYAPVDDISTLPT